MDKKTRNIIILTTIILTALFIGSVLTTAAPESDSNLLEDVWNAIFGIEDEVEVISDDVNVLKSNLDLLERIHELETRVAILENGGSSSELQFPPPTMDSGWLSLTPGEDLTIVHNLETLNYFVYFMVTEDEPSDVTPFTPSSFHNYGTGGAFIEDYTIERMYDTGTYWEATSNTIVIYRYPDDTVCNYGRVMIWVIS